MFFTFPVILCYNDCKGQQKGARLQSCRSCDEYVTCGKRGRAKRKRCGRGEVFSRELRVCVHEHNVVCDKDRLSKYATLAYQKNIKGKDVQHVREGKTRDKMNITKTVTNQTKRNRKRTRGRTTSLQFGRSSKKTL